MPRITVARLFLAREQQRLSLLLNRVCHQALLCAGQNGIYAWTRLGFPRLLFQLVVDVHQEGPGWEAQACGRLGRVVVGEVKDGVSTVAEPGLLSLGRLHLLANLLGHIGRCGVGNERGDDNVGFAQDGWGREPLVELLGRVVGGDELCHVFNLYSSSSHGSDKSTHPILDHGQVIRH